MTKKEIKELVQTTLVPYLIGIRNDMDQNSKALNEQVGKLTKEVKKKSTLEYDLEIDDDNYKGDKGDDAVVDYDAIFSYIDKNLPKRGKEYWTEGDKKAILDQVKKHIPAKPKDGKDGVVDYGLVKELISKRHSDIKEYIDKNAKAMMKAIVKEIGDSRLDALKIRNLLESLTGNARLSAKSIKGLDKFMMGFIATSTGSGGGIGIQDVENYLIANGYVTETDLEDYVPYVGATDNVNINTKNYLAGSLNAPTGTQNLFLGLDDYWAINTVGNLHLQYLSAFGKWYCPTSTAVPPTYTAGDSVVVIISNIPTFLTLATVTPSVVSGPINGYILTFVEAYTPANNDQMNKVADATHILNNIASTKSLILGDFNLTNSFSTSVAILGKSNTDTMLSASPLFILGQSNATRGGFYVGTSNSNTRTTTSNPTLMKTVMIGNSNVDSGTNFHAHILIGDSNNVSGTAGNVNAIGVSNVITSASYVIGTTNTMSGNESFALGRLNTVSGQFGTAIGNLNKSRAYAEVVLGHNSEDVTALNATAYNALDWALRLGAGTGNTSPATSKDIFRIRKNGEINNYLQTASAVGQVIKLFTSATGDAWQIQNVGGTVLTKFIANGSLQFNANDIITDTTTGTKIGTATGQKFGFWNKTPVIQQVTNAYTTDAEATPYTGLDNLQAGLVYASVTDLNLLRVAYETLRASYDDLLTKLKNTGIVA